MSPENAEAIGGIVFLIYLGFLAWYIQHGIDKEDKGPKNDG